MKATNKSANKAKKVVATLIDPEVYGVTGATPKVATSMEATLVVLPLKKSKSVAAYQTSCSAS